MQTVDVSQESYYTFNGIDVGTELKAVLKNKYGCIVSEIEDITVAADSSPFEFPDLKPVKTVAVTVLDADEIDVTAETTVKWFDNENQKLLDVGTALTDVTEGFNVNYTVELNDRLGRKYAFPSSQSHTVENENSVSLVLNPLEKVTVTGKILDKSTQSPIAGAAVSFSQNINKKYFESILVKTNSQGEFIAEIFNCPTTITASGKDYINKSMEIENCNSEYNLGNIELSKITGTVITINTEYTSSKPNTGISQNALDASDVCFSLYNKTRNKPINNFTVQYPTIVLTEETDIGDIVSVTVSSYSGSFSEVLSEGVITPENAVYISPEIVEKGGFKIGITPSENEYNTAMIYNSEGKFVKAGDYTSSGVKIQGLDRGTYTIISIGKNEFVSSISSLDDLTRIGLIENTDYIKNTVTITDGVISALTVNNIPLLDANKFSYIDTESTSFMFNKSSAVIGNYLTLRSKIEFKEEYKAGVTNPRLIIVIPDNCILTENSMSVDKKIAAYTQSGSHVTVPLTNSDDLMRCCIVSTQKGNYSVNGFIEFDFNGETHMQPIGSAAFNANDLSIGCSEKTALENIPFGGRVAANSEVSIYIDDVLEGSIMANACGKHRRKRLSMSLIL